MANGSSDLLLPLILPWKDNASLFGNLGIVAGEDNVETMAGGDTSSVDVDGDSTVSWQCPIFRFVLNTLIMGPTCLLGIACNILSVVVLHGDRRAPTAAFLLQSLAVADSCYLVLWLVNFSCRDLVRYLALDTVEHHVVWLFVRVYTYPGLFVTQSAVIWLTVVIALNRYLVACRPDWLVFLRRYPCLGVKVVVAIVTIMAIAYNVPRYCEMYVMLDSSHGQDLGQGGWSRGKWNKTALGNSALYKLVYVDIMYYVISFVQPLVTLVYVSCCVISAYRTAVRYKWKQANATSSSLSETLQVSEQLQHQPQQQQQQQSSGDSDSNITFVMIVVVLVFMMCQSPARLVQIFWSYSYTSCRHFQFYIIQLSNTLEVLNSSTNFVVYCLFYRRFRRKLQRRLCPLRTASVGSVRTRGGEGGGGGGGGGNGGGDVAARAADITGADTTERLALVTMGDLLPQQLSHTNCTPAASTV